MAAIALDTEFMQYWLKLSDPEKRSLLYVAKNYVSTKADIIEDYNNELDEAVKRIEKEEFYSQEQVVELSKQAIYGS